MVLVPEPEAAGKAFCSLFPDDAFQGSALIVDWGGGTLDLSLVQRTEEGFKIQKSYSQGDETMGGEVLDTIMWNHVANSLKQETGVDLNQEPLGKQRALRKRIRQAKEKLSLVNEYSLTLPMSGGIQNLRIPRREWEEVIVHQLGKVVQMVEDILARLAADHQPAPSIILLVGGSSKTPRLRELLEEKTRLTCKSWDKSMEAVGLGAAFYANELFSPSAFSSQAGNHSASSETGEPEEETTYRIRISEIEAKLGVKKTLKLGEEIISVHIPSDVREGQNVTIPSLVKEGTTYSGVITLQNDPFFQQHAEQGNKEDQYLLGMSYYHGVGIPKSIKKGITWLERAAGQGSVDAQFMMGRICFNGEETKVPDLEKGLMWFKLALTNSHPEAQKWIDKCQRLLNSSDKKETIVVTPYVHYSYTMDHKPFPLYVKGEKYSVSLSDVGEQLLPKLYKGKDDVIVRIKKTYDEKKCLPYYKQKDFDTNQKVNKPTSGENRASSPANNNNSCFWVVCKGIISVFAIILCIIFIINYGARGLVSIFALTGVLRWLWKGK